MLWIINPNIYITVLNSEKYCKKVQFHVMNDEFNNDRALLWFNFCWCNVSHKFLVVFCSKQLIGLIFLYFENLSIPTLLITACFKGAYKVLRTSPRDGHLVWKCWMFSSSSLHSRQFGSILPILNISSVTCKR